MKTDTPETDVWEAYCDECYYHMWRLRRKTERGWYDGYHIHTGEEAKGLCETLNKLERELNEARETIATMEIRHAAVMLHTQSIVDEANQFREQRDRLAEALRYCREDSAELLGERDWWQSEPRCDYAKRWQETHDNLTRADEALQSLTPKP